jgi:AbrB family looped-hinge helix DNA binding protein
MSMLTKQTDNAAICLIKIVRNGQITLPAEVRKTLMVKDGDYLEVSLVNGKLVLTPVSVFNRGKADQRLDEILSRVKYTGPQPAPSEEEILSDVVDIIHQMRRENAEGGAR